jgi:flagellar hook assembly protein FlgD
MSIKNFTQKKLKLFLQSLLSLSFVFILYSISFGAITIASVEPHEVVQGENVKLTIRTSTDIDGSTSGYAVFAPWIILPGTQINSVQYVNRNILVADITVLRDATPGTKTLTVIADTDLSSGVTVDTGTKTDMYLKAKSLIVNCSPTALYKGAGTNRTITLYGNYFYITVYALPIPASFSIAGGGVSQNSWLNIDTSYLTYATISNLDFNSADVTPGGPYPLYLVNYDSQPCLSSTDLDGKTIANLFTIYPQASITSISKTQVYQTEQCDIHIFGTGFHANSVVHISSGPDFSYDSAGIDVIKQDNTNIGSGEITLTINVGTNAVTGDRYFYISNPNGGDSSLNLSTVKTISKFVTSKLTPIVSSMTPANIYQGYIGEVIFTASTATGSGFEYGSELTLETAATDLTLYSASVSSDCKTITAYVKVDPKAAADTRIVTIKNPTYGTQSTYSFTINKSSYSRISDAVISLDTTTFYQGIGSTVTATCSSISSAAFESSATIDMGQDVVISSVVLVSTSSIRFLATPSANAMLGNRSITITNPTYGAKSNLINVTIAQSPYSSMDNLTASPSTLYQGYESTITVTDGTGWFEESCTASSLSSDLTIVGNPIRTSSNTISLHVKVDVKAGLGKTGISITNPNFGITKTCYIDISTSIYSAPTINGLSRTVFHRGGSYENIIATGTNFAPDIKFTISGTGINITNTLVKDSSTVILGLNVLDTADLGNYSLTVSNTRYANATYTLSNAFSVKEKYEITSISPVALVADTTKQFYINGSGFDINSGFRILISSVNIYSTYSPSQDGIVILSSQCVGSQQIYAQIYVEKNIASGGYSHDVSLYFNSLQSSVTLNGSLSISKPPVITGLSGVPLIAGEELKEFTIYGENFEVGADVNITGGGITVTTITYSPNAITEKCTIDSKAEVGTRQLYVYNKIAQSKSNIFSIKVVAPPVISSCTPTELLKDATGYVHIRGSNFSENCRLIFKTQTTNYMSDPAITFLPVDLITGATLQRAGSTDITVRVYVASTAVSGLHDIEIINYTDGSFAQEESRGTAPGIINIKAPLRIDSSEGEFKIPRGAQNTKIIIIGDGFTQDTLVSINSADVEIVKQIVSDEHTIQLLVNINETATIGKKTVIIQEDTYSVYKELIDVVDPIIISNIDPKIIGAGVYHTTVTLTGSGLDLDTTTLKTVTFPGGESYTGIDPAGQVEILGGGISNLVIDKETIKNDSLRLYFTVDEDASIGLRSIVITNKDKKNTITKNNVIQIDQIINLTSFSPSYIQVPLISSQTFTIYGTGLDPNNKYDGTDASTITFTDSRFKVTYAAASKDSTNGADIIVGSITCSAASINDILNKSIGIKIKNRNGTIVDKDVVFTAIQQLMVFKNQCYPNVIPEGADHVTIHLLGQGLLDGASVYFSDSLTPNVPTDQILVQSVEYVKNVNTEELKIVVKTAVDSAGSAQYDVTVKNINGISYSTGVVVQIDNRPAINFATPNKIRAGAKDQNIVLSGFNLTGSANIGSIIFMNQPIYFSTTNITNFEITGKITVDPKCTTGLSGITIIPLGVHPSGYGENILEVLPAPQITSISQDNLYVGENSVITIQGSGFDDGAQLIIADKNGATNYVSLNDVEFTNQGTQIKIGNITIYNKGDYDVKVVNKDGSSVVDEGAIAVYNSVVQANVVNLNPNFVVPGDTNKLITVIGSDFQKGMSIYAEGSDITISSPEINITSATMFVSVKDTAAQGKYNLIFKNPRAQETSVPIFVCVNPSITKVYPAIQIGTEGDVYIEGTNFSNNGGNVQVLVNDNGNKVRVYSASTTWISSSLIMTHVIADADALPGNRDLTVINPFGFQAKSQIGVVAPLAITSISPPKVASENNYTLRIYGTGFESDAQVTIMGGSGVTKAGTEIVQSSSVIEVPITVGTNDVAVGKYGIKVQNVSKGISVTADNILEVVKKVKVDNVTPSTIILYPNAFTMSNVTLDTPTFSVDGSAVHLYNGSSELGYSPIWFSSYPTVQSVIDKINVSSDGWSAAISYTGAGSQPSSYLANVSQTNIKNNPAVLAFNYIGKTVTISGDGFQGSGTTDVPDIAISGEGVSVKKSSTNVGGISSVSTFLIANVNTTQTDVFRDITLTNVDGSYGVGSSKLKFVAPMSINSQSPTKIGIGATSTVDIYGKGFLSNISASIDSPDNGASLNSIQYIDATHLKLQVTIPSIFASAVSTITLTNTDPTLDDNSIKLYLQVDAIPVVSAVAPDHLGQGAGSTGVNYTSLVLTGNNLSNVTKSTHVFISNDINVVGISNVTNSSMTVNVQVLPNATIGKRTIQIKDSIGKQGTSVDVLSIVESPKITKINPSYITPGTTVPIEIQGTGFEYGATLSFSGPGLSVSGYNYLSTDLNNGHITAMVYASSSAVIPGASYDFTITNPDLSHGTQTSVFSILSPPTILGVTQTALIFSKDNQYLDITGSNFTDSDVVTFTGGFITKSEVTARNSNSIQLIVNVGANTDQGLTGSTVLRITNPNSSGYSERQINLIAYPIVTNVTPSFLPLGTTSTIYITGSGFVENGTTVQISNPSEISLWGVEVNGSSELKFNIYASNLASIGNHDITIQTEYGQGVGAGKLNITAPLSIDAVSPGVLAQGSSGKEVIVTGVGFDTGSVVSIEGGGTDITISNTEYINETTLKVILSIGAGTSTGYKEITVKNSKGLIVSRTDLFSVILPITISGITPSSLGIGITGATITIRGTEFKAGAVVTVSGDSKVTVTSTTYKGSTQLWAFLNVDKEASSEYRDIIVTNPDGNTNRLSNALYISGAVTVSAVIKNYFTLIPGATSQNISIVGSGFDMVNIPSITFSAPGLSINPASIVVGANEIKATLLVDTMVVTAGYSDVRVTNSNGTTGLLVNGFIVSDEISITRISPNSLGRGSLKAPLSVIGTGFVDGANITFSLGSGITIVDGSLKVVSDKQIDMSVNIDVSISTGLRNVKVTNPSGETANLTAFTVSSAPVIYTVSPDNYNQGAVAQNLTITGCGFVSGNTSVVIPGVTITSVTVVSSTQLLLKINVNSSAELGTKDVVVTVGSLSGIGRQLFTINTSPRINSITPAQVVQGDTARYLQIQGQGFRTGATIFVNAPGISTTSVTCTSDKLIEAYVNVDSTNSVVGTYDVEVINPDGSNYTATDILSVVALHKVNAVTPSRITRGQSVLLAIQGSGFAGNVKVFIDGDVTVNNDSITVSGTQLLVPVTIGASAYVGFRNITVINGNGSTSIGQNLLEIIATPSVLGSISSSGDSIDYERMNDDPLPVGVTIQYTLNAAVSEVDCVIFDNSGKEVKRMSLYNVPSGTHNNDQYSFFWDGEIDITDTDTTKYAGKINGVYSYSIQIVDKVEAASVKATKTINVDVVNISNLKIKYTEVGEEKAKVAPYTITYNLSKSAYVNVGIYNSSNKLIRSFSSTVGQVGTNQQIWDARDENGVKVLLGVYKVLITAHDDSNPKDYAKSKETQISVDQLKVIDLKVQPISEANTNAVISFTACDSMFINIKIYKPGTQFLGTKLGPKSVSGEVTDPKKLVKTITTSLDQGTSFYVQWDGRDEKNNMLLDGDYVFVITANDSYGNVMADPVIGTLIIRRANSLAFRREMFKNNCYPYPNPVNADQYSEIKIKYGLNRASDLTLQIFDIVGNLIYVKSYPCIEMGEGDIIWDLTNLLNNKVERGLYLYALEARELDSGQILRATNKIMVIKKWKK